MKCRLESVIVVRMLSWQDFPLSITDDDHNFTVFCGGIWVADTFNMFAGKITGFNIRGLWVICCISERMSANYWD